MNILFLTSRLPFPPVGGDRVRTFQFIRYLSRRHKITIVTFVENEDQVKAAESYRDLYHRLVPVPLSPAHSWLKSLRGLASSEPLQAHYYKSARMRAVIAEELARQPYDVAIIHMVRMVPYLDDIPLRKVVDLCDALVLYHQRGTEVSHAPSLASLIHAVEARRLGSYEAGAIRKGDVTLFISQVDADYYGRAGLADKIAIVRNGVDVDTFQFHAERRDDNRIIYLGNMHTFQNTDAAVWFAKKIFPLIKKERPDAVFYIVGNDPSKRVRPLHDGKNVIVTGRVDSVIPYLASSAVMVAPMRAVAGVQNKILESLAVGTPVVTTSIGAEGLEPGVLDVADSPPDFARAVLDLMGDPAKREARSLAGRKYVETYYTWEKALAPLESILSGASASGSLQITPS